LTPDGLEGSCARHNPQRIVLEAFQEHGPMTDREFGVKLGSEINGVTPRRGERAQARLLQEAERRLCTVAGRTAIVWEIQG